MKKNFSTLGILFVAFAAMAFTSCSSDDSDNSSYVPPTPSEQSQTTTPETTKAASGTLSLCFATTDKTMDMGDLTVNVTDQNGKTTSTTMKASDMKTRTQGGELVSRSGAGDAYDLLKDPTDNCAYANDVYYIADINIAEAPAQYKVSITYTPNGKNEGVNEADMIFSSPYVAFTPTGSATAYPLAKESNFDAQIFIGAEIGGDGFNQLMQLMGDFSRFTRTITVDKSGAVTVKEAK